MFHIFFRLSPEYSAEQNVYAIKSSFLLHTNTLFIYMKPLLFFLSFIQLQFFFFYVNSLHLLYCTSWLFYFGFLVNVLCMFVSVDVIVGSVMLGNLTVHQCIFQSLRLPSS